MRKLFLICATFILVGAGCTAKSLPPQVNTSDASRAQKAQTSFTADTSKWVKTNKENGANFSQQVSFSRPPEFTVSGDDADYGRVTRLNFNDKIIFSIIENNIFRICLKETCGEIDELVSVTPEKYLDWQLDIYKKKGLKITQVKIGNVSGALITNENEATTIVLFKNRIYTITDNRTKGNGDQLFESFLNSFSFGR